MPSITIRVSTNGGFDEAAASFKRLQATLRQLQRESPFEFVIVGQTRDVTSFSQIPSRREVEAALNASHPDIYRGSPVGRAWRHRVDAAVGELGKSREAAQRAWKATERPRPVTRVDTQRAYAIANAIFSPEFAIANF